MIEDTEIPAAKTGLKTGPERKEIEKKLIGISGEVLDEENAKRKKERNSKIEKGVVAINLIIATLVLAFGARYIAPIAPQMITKILEDPRFIALFEDTPEKLPTPAVTISEGIPEQPPQQPNKEEAPDTDAAKNSNIALPTETSAAVLNTNPAPDSSPTPKQKPTLESPTLTPEPPATLEPTPEGPIPILTYKDIETGKFIDIFEAGVYVSESIINNPNGYVRIFFNLSDGGKFEIAQNEERPVYFQDGDPVNFIAFIPKPNIKDYGDQAAFNEFLNRVARESLGSLRNQKPLEYIP